MISKDDYHLLKRIDAVCTKQADNRNLYIDDDGKRYYQTHFCMIVFSLAMYYYNLKKNDLVISHWFNSGGDFLTVSPKGYEAMREYDNTLQQIYQEFY